MTELPGNSIKTPCLTFQVIRKTSKSKICLNGMWIVLKIFIETSASPLVMLTTPAETLAPPKAAIEPPGLASPVPCQESLLIPEQDKWALVALES